MTDQPITPADEQVRVEQRHRDAAHDWLGTHKALANRREYSMLARAFARFERDHLTRPSPVVDGELVERIARAAWPDEDAEPFGTKHTILTTLAMRPAPETTASDDVVEAGDRSTPLGLYEVEWHNGEGRKSLAAIYMDETGDRWIAPTNWVRPARLSFDADCWHGVKTLANLPKPTEQATSPAPDAVLREALEAFPDRTDFLISIDYANACDEWWHERGLPALTRGERT